MLGIKAHDEAGIGGERCPRGLRVLTFAFHGLEYTFVLHNLFRGVNHQLGRRWSEAVTGHGVALWPSCRAKGSRLTRKIPYCFCPWNWAFIETYCDFDSNWMCVCSNSFIFSWFYIYFSHSVKNCKNLLSPLLFCRLRLLPRVILTRWPLRGIRWGHLRGRKCTSSDTKVRKITTHATQGFVSKPSSITLILTPLYGEERVTLDKSAW